MDFHDNSLVRLEITRVQSSATVVLEMTDYETKRPITVTFADCDWISSDIAGIVSNEMQIIDVSEAPW